MNINQFDAENNRRIQLNEENAIFRSQIAEAKKENLPFDHLQDLIDENVISLNLISTEICSKIIDTESVQNLKDNDCISEQFKNAINFMDALLHNAIYGAFQFAIIAAGNSIMYDWNDKKLIKEGYRDFLQTREDFAWIETDDDEFYKPEIKEKNYKGPFTFNYICYCLGADNHGIRKAFLKLREMSRKEIKIVFFQYKNKSFRQSIETESHEEKELINWIPIEEPTYQNIEREEELINV